MIYTPAYVSLDSSYTCVYLRVSATLVTCVDNVVSEGHNIVDR